MFQPNLALAVLAVHPLFALPLAGQQSKVEPKLPQAAAPSKAKRASTPRRARKDAQEKYGPRFSTRKRHSFIPGSTGAVAAGLTWLVAHQSEDGRWSGTGFMDAEKSEPRSDGRGQEGNDVGLTGLALLALLGDGHTTKRGKYKDAVLKGCDFLLGQQDPKKGLLGTSATMTFIYNHAIAANALVEAAGLDGSPKLEKGARAALAYLEYHRNPYACWRYQPRDNDNDLSVTLWATMAISAGVDFGFTVDPKILRLVRGYVAMLTDPKDGSVGYTRRGSRSSRNVGDHRTKFPADETEAMTAAGLWVQVLVRNQLDERTLTDTMQLSAKRLMETLPSTKKAGAIDYYYWLHASHALAQIEGIEWKRWANALSSAVVMKQRRDGNFAGSWDDKCAWAQIGGRVYATAMAVLILESEYRFGRLLAKPADPRK